MHTASVMIHLYARIYNAHVHAYIYRCRPFAMWRGFEGGIYWGELAEMCNDVSRAVGFQGAVRDGSR